jgi:hypothetical protein
MTKYSLPGWREDLLQTDLLNQEERNLLSKGPSNLAQAWRMQAIKYKYVTHGINN